MDDLLSSSIEGENTGTDHGGKRRDEFVTTLWNMVVEAGASGEEKAAAALHRLCSIYWYPIYAFIRRRGSTVPEAEDLTQAFFAHLLERQTLCRADQKKGKFRSFLLASLNYFLKNEWDKRVALKRGGHRQVISLDEATAEGLYLREPAANLTPERLFDRRWATTLVERVLRLLREEYETASNAALLGRLEPMLTQDIPAGLYAQLATEFSVNEGTAKVALHRLRRRFGELLRREVAITVADAASLDEEVRYLLSAISD